MFNKKFKAIKAQVWIETVIYIMIGLAIIAVIMAMAIPQVEKMKDKSIVEQTVTAMNLLDDKISEAEQSEGNIRVVNFKIAKGRLEIDSPNDQIRYVLEDTKLELSQEDIEIKQGNIIIKTEKKSSGFEITLTMEYDELDITYDGTDEMQTLHSGTTPYKITLENKGAPSIGEKTQMDFNSI